MPKASSYQPVSEPTSRGAATVLASKGVVLIVDDQPRILHFLATKPESAGYQVVTAEGGEDALRIIGSLKPRVVLLDILMSPVDGLEVLKRLSVGSSVPVIAMSALHNTRDEALRLGAKAFLKKPFNPSDAVREIETVLGRS